MNKIININLAGQAIAIDEKAYETLKKYLATLEKHFNNTASANEILEDIEARIAEMFQVKIRAGHTFIDQKSVDEAVEVMGSPSDMGFADEESYDDSNSSTSYQNVSKKLYRDSDDKVLGGVCSGLAAYFGLDTSIIRLAFVVSVIFAGFGILPYIILWAVVPETKTPQDRFRMRGESPDIDGIAAKIRREAENVADNIKKNDNINSAAKGIGDLIGNIIKWISKLFGSAVLMALIVVAVAIATIFLFGLSDPTVRINGNLMTIPYLFESSLLSKFFLLALLSIILIPIGAAIYLLIAFIFNIPMQRFNLKAIFAAWLLCLAIFVGISIYGSSQIRMEEWEDFRLELRETHTI